MGVTIYMGEKVEFEWLGEYLYVHDISERIIIRTQ